MNAFKNDLHDLVADYDALAARLVEALTTDADSTPAPVKFDARPRFVKLDASGRATAGDHVAVYDHSTDLVWTAEPLGGGKEFKHAPERCCLDYPRCDCNSPPEPDNAPAVTGLSQQDYDALVRDAMLWRARSPTGAGGNVKAFVCCEGVDQHAPGCIAQEAAI